MEPTRTAVEERRLGRSVLAVIAGMLAGAFLSLGTDELLHVLKVYPPWNEPMRDAGLNALALGYRIVYDTLGSYLTARLAPRRPMRHALIGGAIGLVPTIGGVIAATQVDLGPIWYPIALAVSVMPTAWLGGILHGVSARQDTRVKKEVQVRP
jgi:hypothetical protein